MQLPDTRCKHVIKLWGLDETWVKSHWSEFKFVWEAFYELADMLKLYCTSVQCDIEELLTVSNPDKDWVLCEINLQTDLASYFKKWFPEEMKPFFYYEELADEWYNCEYHSK